MEVLDAGEWGRQFAGNPGEVQAEAYTVCRIVLQQDIIYKQLQV